MPFDILMVDFQHQNIPCRIYRFGFVAESFIVRYQ